MKSPLASREPASGRAEYSALRARRSAVNGTRTSTSEGCVKASTPPTRSHTHYSPYSKSRPSAQRAAHGGDPGSVEGGETAGKGDGSPVANRRKMSPRKAKSSAPAPSTLRRIAGGLAGWLFGRGATPEDVRTLEEAGMSQDETSMEEDDTAQDSVSEPYRPPLRKVGPGHSSLRHAVTLPNLADRAAATNGSSIFPSSRAQIGSNPLDPYSPRRNRGRSPHATLQIPARAPSPVRGRATGSPNLHRQSSASFACDPAPSSAAAKANGMMSATSAGFPPDFPPPRSGSPFRSECPFRATRNGLSGSQSFATFSASRRGISPLGRALSQVMNGQNNTKAYSPPLSDVGAKRPWRDMSNSPPPKGSSVFGGEVSGTKRHKVWDPDYGFMDKDELERVQKAKVLEQRRKEGKPLPSSHAERLLEALESVSSPVRDAHRVLDSNLLKPPVPTSLPSVMEAFDEYRELHGPRAETDARRAVAPATRNERRRRAKLAEEKKAKIRREMVRLQAEKDRDAARKKEEEVKLVMEEERDCMSEAKSPPPRRLTRRTGSIEPRTEGSVVGALTRQKRGSSAYFSEDEPMAGESQPGPVARRTRANVKRAVPAPLLTEAASQTDLNDSMDISQPKPPGRVTKASSRDTSTEPPALAKAKSPTASRVLPSKKKLRSSSPVPGDSMAPSPARSTMSPPIPTATAASFTLPYEQQRRSSSLRPGRTFSSRRHASSKVFSAREEDLEDEGQPAENPAFEKIKLNIPRDLTFPSSLNTAPAGAPAQRPVAEEKVRTQSASAENNIFGRVGAPATSGQEPPTAGDLPTFSFSKPVDTHAPAVDTTTPFSFGAKPAAFAPAAGLFSSAPSDNDKSTASPQIPTPAPDDKISGPPNFFAGISKPPGTATTGSVLPFSSTATTTALAAAEKPPLFGNTNGTSEVTEPSVFPFGSAKSNDSPSAPAPFSFSKPSETSAPPAAAPSPFTFAGANGASTPAASSFSFSAPADASKPAAPSFGGFAGFGKPEEAVKPPPSPFEASATTASSAPAQFSFGAGTTSSNEAVKPATAFSFGQPAPTVAPASTNATFSFGEAKSGAMSTTQSSSAFGSSAPATSLFGATSNPTVPAPNANTPLFGGAPTTSSTAPAPFSFSAPAASNPPSTAFSFNGTAPTASPFGASASANPFGATTTTGGGPPGSTGSTGSAFGGFGGSNTGFNAPTPSTGTTTGAFGSGTANPFGASTPAPPANPSPFGAPAAAGGSGATFNFGASTATPLTFGTSTGGAAPQPFPTPAASANGGAPAFSFNMGASTDPNGGTGGPPGGNRPTRRLPTRGRKR